MRAGDQMAAGGVCGQRVELADLLTEGFEVLFEAPDLVDRVVCCDCLVEFEEGSLFGCVDAGSAYFVGGKSVVP